MILNLTYKFVCYSYEEAREIQTALLFAGSIHLVTCHGLVVISKLSILGHFCATSARDGENQVSCLLAWCVKTPRQHQQLLTCSLPGWISAGGLERDSWILVRPFQSCRGLAQCLTILGFQSQPRKVPGWTVRAGFWMFLLVFFLGPFETLFLGEYFREQCRGFFQELFLIGTVSTGFPGKYLGNFSGVFLRDLPGDVWTLGNFLRNFLGDLLGEHPRGDFWIFLKGTSWVIFWELDLAWTSLGTCDPPNITVYNFKYFKLHSSLSFHQTLKVSSPQGSLPRRASSWKFRAT